ncbi:MAG: FimB/Mfa2 family fimbrial subunit [Muribaculaceae bacterium]|nr:FimB/Mfa2 family fimbrial subunit [Muribaculaceae bacterium]
MTRRIRRYIRNASAFPALLGMLLMAMLPSLGGCDAMHSDLEPCPQGVSLRFRSNHYIDDGEFFAANVDCLTVFVFDSIGHRVLPSMNFYAPEISDENWRLPLDLPEGKYTILAYGGMACEKSSFRFDFHNDTPDLEDIEVVMKPSVIGRDPGVYLHPLYYGITEVEVPSVAESTGYVAGTINMWKDTNNVRILLANAAGVTIDVEDFDFRITDDNTRMNWENNVIPSQTVTYYPWISGNTVGGLNVAGDPFMVAYAEISTGRFMRRSQARLLVTRSSDGESVIDLPLVNILLLMQSEAYSYLSPQDFLDRENRWELTFFLTEDGRWLDTTIRINDWVVRINNIVS